MTSKKTMIEVKAPNSILLRKRKSTDATVSELIMSKGHTCSYCNGKGWYWSESYRGDREKADCPVCQGSGMLDAVIKVDWVAHE